MWVFYKLLNKVNRISKRVYAPLIAFAIFFSLPVGAMEDGDGGSDRKVVRILTVDGGGVRGIIPATVLRGIEEQLHTGKREEEKLPLAEYFDIMAGTSTGGIIVLGLNAGMSAKNLVDLYLNHSEDIFPPVGLWDKAASYTGPKFSHEPLEKILDEKVGDRWLSESVSHVLIPAENMGQTYTHLFNSAEAKKFESQDYKMKDVARATSAAPTFFEAATISNREGDESTFLDGGVSANDPTFEAIEIAEQKFPGCDIFIISLGTGEPPRKFGDYSLKTAGKIGWAPKIADELMTKQQDRHLRVVHSIKNDRIQQDRKFVYHRIQVSIDRSIADMDNAENVKSLRQAGLSLINPLNPSGVYSVITDQIIKVLEENPEVQQKEMERELL